MAQSRAMGTLNSNTTLVKVKLYVPLVFRQIYTYSNTTLVKVKFCD